ncbi:MAG: hypothetical protein ACM3QS_06065 [Bacteroidota bacterium]
MFVENNKKTFLIINDGPYGNERPYNALRLALSLSRRSEEAEVRAGGSVRSAKCTQGY